MTTHQTISRVAVGALIVMAADPAFGGYELAPAPPDQKSPSAIKSLSAQVGGGYSSKYIFRGTNLTPDSDGLIWADGSISVSPWDSGTFTLGFWIGSQVGTSTFSSRESGAFASESARIATDFTARNKTLGRLGLFNPERQFLDVRGRDRDFLSGLLNETFTGRSGVHRHDVFDYIADSYAYLRYAPGHLNYPYYRPPIFAIYDTVTGNLRDFRTARQLGFPKNAEGFVRASGYGGRLPAQITRIEHDLELTQRDFRELRIPLSYRQEVGPLLITVGNTFYYAEEEIIAREVLRERFASDEARQFIDFASRTDLYVGQRVGSAGNRWYPQLLAPMLPIRPGHPEDFLREQTTVRRVTARQTYDRLDLELSANSKWLVDHGYAWARYLRPHAAFSYTLYNDVDTGEVVLPNYSTADHGSYAAVGLDAHLPLLRESKVSGKPVSPPAHARAGDTKLSLDVATLLSASFGDRPGGDGKPVRGWHDFEMRAELNWWITPSWRVAPSINYYALISEPPPGTNEDAFWYGFHCEVLF